MINDIENLTIAIIGLGYVGLPLALEFAKKKSIIGFDINKERIRELNSGIDRNLEFNKNELQNYKWLKFSNNVEDIRASNCYIITVPTPINKLKQPDLSPLCDASKMIGKIINKDDLIIYESTVYPGCIEDKCVPILEKFSGLNFNKDFFCGY